MKKENDSSGEIRHYLALAWRRKWVILVPFVIIGMAVSLYGLYIPDLYQSSTLIFLEPQDVPKDYVRPTVTSDLGSRLRSISRQMKSRTNLLKVRDELSLYQDPEGGRVDRERAVIAMRKALSVELPTSREAQNYFQVNFVHRDPTKAMLAVSRIVSIFIEESLQTREEQATGTTQFIEEELDKLREILDRQEAAVQAFKRRYMGGLPSQLDANLRVLDSLQTQLSDSLLAQRELENRLSVMEQDIIRLEGQTRTIGNITGESEPMVNVTLSQLISQRDSVLQRVSSMELTYTPRHPDLIKARKELKKLDDRIQRIHREMSTDTDAKRPVNIATPTREYNMELQNLKRQFSDNRPRLVSFQEEERELREKIHIYQQRVEVTPRREQELLSLTRDYDNTKASYDELLNKKMEAQLSENLEKRQKGEKFHILDPANLPEKPYLPNRFKIIFMGLAGGLGLGLGLALLLEMLFPVFNDITPLKNNLDTPIIMAIPEIIDPRDKNRKRIRLLLSAGAGMGLSVAAIFVVNRYVFDLTNIVDQILKNIRSM